MGGWNYTLYRTTGYALFFNKNCSSLVNHPYFPQGATDIQLTRSCMHILIWMVHCTSTIIHRIPNIWVVYSLMEYLCRFISNFVPDSRLQVPSIAFEHSPVLLQCCSWVSDSLPLRLRSSRWLGTCAIWRLCSLNKSSVIYNLLTHMNN